MLLDAIEFQDHKGFGKTGELITASLRGFKIPLPYRNFLSYKIENSFPVQKPIFSCAMMSGNLFKSEIHKAALKQSLSSLMTISR